MGETVRGIGAIGSAVGSNDSQPAVGLALSFPVNAVNRKQHDEMIELMVDCAAGVAAKTGDPLWAARLKPQETDRRSRRPAGTGSSAAA